MRTLSTGWHRGIMVLLLLAGGVSLSAATIDFEGLSDSTIVTTQYPGLTFTNTVILTSGISLNEFELPPHSGVNVVSDNGGPITIDFATPVTSFSAYFTYLEPLTLAGFNASATQIATAASLFLSNDALFGDAGSSPKELITLSFAGGISSITITGDPTGGSFVMDDVTYTGGTSTVPEPSSFILVLTAAVILIRLPKSQTVR